MRRAQAALAKHDLPLACNQVEYNLLKRDIERNGVQAACRELGVTVVAYRPFAYGYLSGKVTPDQHLKGWQRFAVQRGTTCKRCRPWSTHMRQAGEAHGGKSPAQVALNWLMCKGAYHPGRHQGQAYPGERRGFRLGLTDEEVARLEAAEESLHNR